MTPKKLSALAVAFLLLAGTAAAQQGHPLLDKSETGNPKIQSVDSIAFAPQGLLLIGDGKGRQVVAVDTKDTTPIKWTKTEIANFDNVVAGRIGTTAAGIDIIRLIVNPASNRAYIAVRKKDDKKGLVLSIDGDGKVSEVNLDKVTYASLPLPKNDKTKISLITDVTWAQDRILASVQANETFGSRIFSAHVPVVHNDEGALFSTETFHVAHNKWETKAPIHTVIPYEENGQRYLVGAFTCTPLVKYPLDKLTSGAKVTGQTVIEVGNGNTPRDLFTYQKDGKSYILMSTVRNAGFQKSNPIGPSPYWVVRLDYSLLSETTKVNEKAINRIDKSMKPLTDKAHVVESFHGVMFMDKLGPDRALVIRADIKDKNKVSLTALPLP